MRQINSIDRGRDDGSTCNPYREKLRELRSERERKVRFVQHLEHQEQRLNRMAELIEVAPSEMDELLNLILEYWRSAGVITARGLVRLPKRTL
ncbi:MAG: hypothetical protein ABSG44_18535 [Thermodesulfobacteriota bacterium]|jgi:hypothetical protein